MSRWCANAKSRPSAPRASSRRPGRSRPPRRSRRRKISSTTCARARPQPTPPDRRCRTRNPVQQPLRSAIPMRHFAGAAKTIEAEYEIPFQGHTAFAGAHAMADPSNGQMTVYSNDMKSYGMRRGVATFLGMPHGQVRVVWMHGPQGFGRTAAEDAACEAAWIAQEIGRPVRMQWMRDEETAWDTKSPAFLVKMRGASGCTGAPDRLRLQRALVRLQPPRLQRARHRADRAAHGHAADRPAAGSCRHALRHVCDSESQDGWRGRGTPAHLGNAAAHRQSARSERSAVDVRRRIVHRRSGRGGESRSAGIPHEACSRPARATTAASGARAPSRCSRPPPSLRLGSRGLRRSRAAKATS